VGTLLDSTIFIQLERELSRSSAFVTHQELSSRLQRALGEDEDVAIAAITASELLHGVHRASEEHVVRREAFVESILAAFPPIPFDLRCARVHARLWAELARAGSDVGPHDRLVAATALATGWRVATANVRHYARIRGLEVVNPDLS
jgi:tRNA(fMet)-specific endonuclease VapC